MREIRIPGIRRVMRISWSRTGIDREIDDEIRFHLDARAEELRHAGLSLEEAQARARHEYGDVDESRQELVRVDRRRAARRDKEEILMSMRDDLRYAVRSLARRPALVGVIAGTLGIGIAANTIMFGVVDQLLLRPPAGVVAPDAVKRVYYQMVDQGKSSAGAVTTYPVLTALRANVPAFSDLAAYSSARHYSLGRGRDAQSVAVQLVSGNYFRLLGTKPALGRTFVDSDDRVPNGEAVAVVSFGLWQRVLGGAQDALGHSLLIQGKNFTVVGVAPRGFSGIDRDQVDVWVPISALGNEVLGKGWYDTHSNWWASIIGRLRDGVSPAVAEAQSTTAYRNLVRDWPQQRFRDSSSVVLSSVIGTRTPDGLSPEGKVSLWLIGVSGIVLLIACANVANLLIVRTAERRREIAVRIALGVSRARLVRMLLTESVLLALSGAGIALILTFGASRIVQNVLLPNIVWNDSVIDLRVLSFTLAATVVCVILAGMAPTMQGVGTNVSWGLRESSRQVAGSRGRLRSTLLVAQAALSVVLLVGAGLCVQSLHNIVTRQVGIDRDRVLRVTMPLAEFGFDTTQIEDIYRRGTERISAIPGVTSVSMAGLSVPMGTASAFGFRVPGVKNPGFELGGPYNSVVTAGFFNTIGDAIVRGRDFTPAEVRSGARVVIVNDLVANAYWPHEDPLGQCVYFGSDKDCSHVIGVVRTVMQFSLIKDDRAMAYAPLHHPGAADVTPVAMLVRTAGDPAKTVGTVRRELQALSPMMPFVSVSSYRELVAPQLQRWRLSATMFTLFGALAVLIASVGLYSVMAYWVSQRTHEIGVRMALGAMRSDVVRLVAWQSSRPILTGLAIGCLTAFYASRWITDMLYETSPRDPLVYGGAAVVLAVAAMIASVVPARRSTAVDPAQAIRTE